MLLPTGMVRVHKETASYRPALCKMCRINVEMLNHDNSQTRETRTQHE